MAAAVPVQTPAEQLPAEHLEPLLGSCRVCSAVVLVVELVDGGDVALEPREVLERHECPMCRKVRAMRSHYGTPHRRHECERCQLTGYIGEPLPEVGFALDG
jgi:hypothetical protein